MSIMYGGIKLQQNCQTQGKYSGLSFGDWLEGASHMLLDRGMMGDGVADLKSIRQWVEQASYSGLCEVNLLAENCETPAKRCWIFLWSGSGPSAELARDPNALIAA